MNFDFTGQVALITGGASGIGRGMVEAFAAHGAQVAFTWFTSQAGADELVKGIEQRGGQALAVQADLTHEAEVTRVIDAVMARFGRIDILVTNSGGILKRTKITDCTLDLWNEAMAVNVTSMFLCCKAVLPHMQQAGKGCIITMSSLAAHTGGGGGAVHYATTKGAILTFTRGLAKEVGPLGIRVNGLAPGLIGTQFHDRFSTPEMRQSSVAQTPLRREGTPEDVANATLFLASPASSFLAGETIEINGGQGMY
jgi:3-oxoacyl-[acyl-carrier protein] reductase